LGGGDGDGDGFGAAGFEELIEGIEFALERAFGGGFVAEMEIVFLDFRRRPIEGRARADGAEKVVKIAVGADATPFGLGGFIDEIVFEGVFRRLVFGEPAVEETVPVLFGFDVGEDEGFGTATMLQRILRGAEAAFRSGRAGFSGIAFFGWFRGFGKRGVGRWLGRLEEFVEILVEDGHGVSEASLE